MTRPHNTACDEAGGELLAFWDDDDWHGPLRLERQIEPLLRGTADLTGLRIRCLLELPRRKFWTASDPLHREMFICDVAGGTAAFPRRLWNRGLRYPNYSVGEDGAFLREAARLGRRVQRIDGDDLFVYVRHGRNTWRFTAGTHANAAGWSELQRPPAFSPELLEAYAAAAEAHARTPARK